MKRPSIRIRQAYVRARRPGYACLQPCPRRGRWVRQAMQLHSLVGLLGEAARRQWAVPATKTAVLSLAGQHLSHASDVRPVHPYKHAGNHWRSVAIQGTARRTKDNVVASASFVFAERIIHLRQWSFPLFECTYRVSASRLESIGRHVICNGPTWACLMPATSFVPSPHMRTCSPSARYAATTRS